MAMFAKCFIKFSLIFGCVFFIACDNGTDGGGNKGIKNCPDISKKSIAEYLANIALIKQTAFRLDNSPGLIDFRNLKNIAESDGMIGKALSHCPELMDIPGDKCQSGDKTLDLKVVKEQCGKLKLIFDAYQKFSHVNAATKREDLSPTEEKDVKAYIDLIIAGFRSGG